MSDEGADGVGGGIHQLKRDFVRYLPSQVIPALLGFVAIPIVTRLFSPADYGDYRLVLATLGAFSAMSVWMASSIYRFFPELEVEGRLDELLVTLVRLLFITLVILSGVWLIGLGVLGSVLSQQLRRVMLIGAALLTVNTVWSVTNALVRVQRQVGWYSAGVVFNRAASLAAGVALVVGAGLGIDGLLYGSMIASIAALPFLIRIAIRRLPLRAGRFSPRLSIDMLRYAAPLVLGQLSAWLLALSDRYVIASLRGSTEVGLYTAAYGVAEQSVAVILTMFQLPFAVLGSRVWEREGREAAAQFVTASARGYLLAVIPAWLGISVLASDVMAVMTDIEYRAAASVMPWVAGALVLWGIQYWFSAAAGFVKKTSRYALAVMSGVVVNLVLNLLLVGRYGYQAAAITTLLAYAVSLVAMAALARKEFRWRFPWRSVVRSMLAAGVMMAVLVLIFRWTALTPIWTLLIGIPVGALTYGAMLVAMGEVSISPVRRYLRRTTP